MKRIFFNINLFRNKNSPVTKKIPVRRDFYHLIVQYVVNSLNFRV